MEISGFCGDWVVSCDVFLEAILWQYVLLKQIPERMLCWEQTHGAFPEAVLWKGMWRFAGADTWEAQDALVLVRLAMLHWSLLIWQHSCIDLPCNSSLLFTDLCFVGLTPSLCLHSIVSNVHSPQKTKKHRKWEFRYLLPWHIPQPNFLLLGLPY